MLGKVDRPIRGATVAIEIKRSSVHDNQTEGHDCGHARRGNAVLAGGSATPAQYKINAQGDSSILAASF